MASVTLIYCPFPTRDTACTTLQQLLAERLVACGNLHAQGLSLYHWQGKQEESSETYLLCKTTDSLAPRAAHRLEALHPYDLPALLYWQAQCTPAFAAWVAAETQEKQ